MQAMKPVMDRDTAEHFYAWLESKVAEDEQSTVEDAIHLLLIDHPDLVLTRTWTEMRALAERNYNVESIII